MAIIKCFKHQCYYLDSSGHTIEVQSDHQNLQGFMKQPKINSRQAKQLVYLTPYDFIIKHRLGLLNPADGLSRRLDYKAQEEPSLVQKDILASKLNRPDLLETARLNTELCDIVKCQLCNTVRQPNQLCDAARTELNVIARTEFFHLPQAELCDTAGAIQRVNARSPLVDSKG